MSQFTPALGSALFLAVEATRRAVVALIVAGVPGEVRKAMRQTGLPQRFDSLLALTYHLNHYDEWMHDNDVSDECGAALRCLAAAWKDLLAHDDAALGIDAEFTRPGTEALVTAIADTAKSLDYAFPWR